MNYKIIADPDALRHYIDWLPECQEGEQFYVTPFMRKKYIPDVDWMRADKQSLRRFTSTKDRLFDKILQLECPVGAYKHGEHVVPQEALAL